MLLKFATQDAKPTMRRSGVAEMVGETNSVRINGEHKRVKKGLTVRQLVEEMGMAKASVERNAEPLTDFDQCVQDGDDYEIFEKL